MKTEPEDRVSALPGGLRLVYHEKTESTNDDVRELGESGEPDGVVVLAGEQSRGRGRRGAAWVSPAGQSLAFSLLARPEEPQALWPRLAIATGVAVAEALDGFGVEAGVKWPNDVWVAGKKICGILVEGGGGFAVIGVGLNVNVAEFSGGLEEIATSLRIETGREFPCADVLAAVLGRLQIRRRQIGADFPRVLRALSERCVLAGRRVSLTSGGRRMTGMMEGYGPGGELLLRTANGLETVIQADEVRPEGV